MKSDGECDEGAVADSKAVTQGTVASIAAAAASTEDGNWFCTVVVGDCQLFMEFLALHSGMYGVVETLGFAARGATVTLSAARAEAAVASWAKLATQNSGSTTVILGKYTGAANPTSYQNIAKAFQATYFQLSDEAWNALAKAGSTWAVNQAFLQQQVSQGKTFILTSDPATATGSFLNEVNFLINQGYQFVNSGQFWTAVK